MTRYKSRRTDRIVFKVLYLLGMFFILMFFCTISFFLGLRYAHHLYTNNLAVQEVECYAVVYDRSMTHKHKIMGKAEIVVLKNNIDEFWNF